jgi:hypothetical protein
MCGDVISAMLDPTVLLPGVAARELKPSRTRLKRFTQFENRKEYVDKFIALGRDIILPSHDTELSIKYFRKCTVQLYTSDHTLFSHFAQRVWDKSDDEVLYRMSRRFGLKYTKGLDAAFRYDYAKSLREWQTHFRFAKRIDVSDIYKDDFVAKLSVKFPHIDVQRAKTIHTEWLELNSIT